MALNKALGANRKRIKNEVIAFKNELLDKKNESEDVEPIIKKLLNKFGKPASAIHIEEFLKPDEKEQVKARIVGSKIPEIDNIDTNIAKFLDIKDCLQLADYFNPNSSTEEAEHGAHAATLSANEEGSQLDDPAEEPDFLSAVVEGLQPYPTQNTDLVGEISAGFVSYGLES